MVKKIDGKPIKEGKEKAIKKGGVEKKPKKNFSKRDDSDDEAGPSGRPEKPTIGQITSGIKNKMKRSEIYQKLKAKAKKEKREVRKKRQKEAERAEAMGLEPPPKQAPRTIENTREQDETMVDPQDDEVQLEENDDEFAAHFACVRPPNVLITTSRKPSKISFKFISELLEVFPCAMFAERRGYNIKDICKYADNRNFSDVLIWNEDKKKVNGLIHVHLPDGPTAYYKVSNVRLSEDIKNCGRATNHKPELILNNFDTRLGRRVGRMFASLFHQEPQFRGRRVVTFHNQRDFIFFRHHRYIFDEKEVKPTKKGEQEGKEVRTRLQELGPRFTLKLMSLQKGTFNSKGGEFEWVRAPDSEANRKRFYL